MKFLILALALISNPAFAAGVETNLTVCKVREVEGDNGQGKRFDGETIAEQELKFAFAHPSDLRGPTEVVSKKYPGLKVEFHWGVSAQAVVQMIIIDDEERKISVADSVSHPFEREGDTLRLPKAELDKVYNIDNGQGLDRIMIRCLTNFPKL